MSRLLLLGFSHVVAGAFGGFTHWVWSKRKAQVKP